MNKKKIELSVLLMLLLLLTFGLGYWAGISRARKVASVIVAIDTADSKQSSGKSGYDPYYSKQNAIPDRVK